MYYSFCRYNGLAHHWGLMNILLFLYKDAPHKELRSILQRRDVHTLLQHLVATGRQITAALTALPTAGNGRHENDVVSCNHGCLLVTEQGGSLRDGQLPFIFLRRNLRFRYC